MTASTTLGPGVDRARASSSANSSASRLDRLESQTIGQLDEVDGRTAEVEHVAGPGSRAVGTHPVELHVEHRVGVVVEQDGGHVEALARHGPPRLERVERAAVRLECNHPSVG